MEKLSKYFINTLLGSLLISNFTMLNAQGNCLIYPEDSGERIACELSYRAIEYKQGSRMSQILFDEAIRIGPNYAYAYYQKSVPFFKRGLLNEGITLLNKAVELEPNSYYQTYRAYWYFSHHSYTQCIKDLEAYYTANPGQMESTPGGEMDMGIILGISYFKQNKAEKGIESVVNRINTYSSKSYIGLYDYYVLGALYYQNNQLKKAENAFKKQLTLNPDYADTYYYLGLIKASQSNKADAKQLFQEALNRYNRENGGYSRSLWGMNVSKREAEEALNSSS